MPLTHTTYSIIGSLAMLIVMLCTICSVLRRKRTQGRLDSTVLDVVTIFRRDGIDLSRCHVSKGGDMIGEPSWIRIDFFQFGGAPYSLTVDDVITVDVSGPNAISTSLLRTINSVTISYCATRSGDYLFDVKMNETSIHNPDLRVHFEPGL